MRPRLRQVLFEKYIITVYIHLYRNENVNMGEEEEDL